MQTSHTVQKADFHDMLTPSHTLWMCDVVTSAGGPNMWEFEDGPSVNQLDVDSSRRRRNMNQFDYDSKEFVRNGKQFDIVSSEIGLNMRQFNFSD
jgi:hypothetical protein